MPDMKLQVILEAVDAGYSQTLGKAQQQGERLAQMGQRVGIGLGLMSAGILAGAASTVGAAAQMEMATASFTQMLGSEAEATRYVAELRKFATQTPFEFKDLTQASRLMLAFGFAAKDVIPMLTDIGDAMGALGANAEVMNRVIRNFGQIQAKGKLSMEEVLQLAEAGIPVFSILQKHLGLSAAQMGDIGRQGISADRAIAALRKGMAELYGGGMQKQMGTTAGALSNFSDAIFNLKVAMGEALTPAVKALTPALTDFANVLSWLAKNPLGQLLIEGAAGFGLLGAALSPLLIALPTLREIWLVLRGIAAAGPAAAAAGQAAAAGGAGAAAGLRWAGGAGAVAGAVGVGLMAGGAGAAGEYLENAPRPGQAGYWERLRYAQGGLWAGLKARGPMGMGGAGYEASKYLMGMGEYGQAPQVNVYIGGEKIDERVQAQVQAGLRQAGAQPAY